MIPDLETGSGVSDAQTYPADSLTSVSKFDAVIIERHSNVVVALRRTVFRDAERRSNFGVDVALRRFVVGVRKVEKFTEGTPVGRKRVQRVRTSGKFSGDDRGGFGWADELESRAW